MPTKALDFLKGPFKSMLTSPRANNHDEPAVYYTDNVDADRNFLECFPSLTNDVARLESTPDQTVAPSLPMLSIAIMMLKLSQVSLSRYIKDGRNKAFPQGLKELIGCGEVMKVGRSVKNDLQRLFNDYNVVYNGFLELHRLCYDVGLFLTPGKDSSLAALTRIILEKTLPKGNIRASNWDAICLSTEQKDYAALDAWVALEIYYKVNGLLNQSGLLMLILEIL
ncbi:ribonuclease H-like domain-containing protein [Pilobolus umbonatus]|nr:ribonuclease H-like domain-containing protein [Pilobolus umbonatus]